MIDSKLSLALDQSLYTTINTANDDGALPNKIIAVRVDVAVLTAHGWQPAISGRVVALEEGVEFNLSGDEVKE